MNELKPLYDDHKVEVPRRVWNQIEGKLNEKKQKQKYFRLRAISAVAACFIIASVLSYIKLGFESHNPGLFVTNESYKSMIFEQLDEVDAPLYDYEQVKDLKNVIIAQQPSFANRTR